MASKRVKGAEPKKGPEKDPPEAAPKPPPKPNGRPPTHTPETWAEILRRHSNGETITAICRGETMPEPVSVAIKAANDPAGFGKAYTRARLMFADAIFDEAMLIADGKDTPLIYAKITTVTGKVREYVDVGAMKSQAMRDRLRVDTRLRLVPKINPEKYGDRLNLHHSGGVDFGQMDDAALNARLVKQLHDLGVIKALEALKLTAVQIDALVQLFLTPELPTKPEPPLLEHEPKGEDL